MKKKILIMGVISLFLLAGLTTVYAAEIKTSEPKLVPSVKPVVVGSDDLPDLTIKIKNVHYSWASRLYIASIYIKNKGTATVSADETLELLGITLDNGEEVWSEIYDWSHNLPLEPGQEKGFTYTWEDSPPKATLKAVVDPENLIEESDESEENNTFTISYPYSRQQSIKSPFLNFLENHPSMFPILRLLLQRLGL